MRIKRKLLASFVILCCTLVLIPTQHAASPFYYHWVGRNSVYLWLSETDPKPIYASEQDGVWTFDPADTVTDPLWLAIVAAEFRNLPAGTDQWKAFFKYLRDEYPNNDWAKIRNLDLQIYLRTHTTSRLQVTYLKDGVPTTVAFTKSEQRWRADCPELLVQLARDYSAETKAMLGVKEPLEPEAKLLEAWEAWLNKINFQEAPIAKLLPVLDESGQARAVWLERLSEADWYRRFNLLIPKATPTSTSPETTNARPPARTGQDWQFYTKLWFQLLMLSVVVALLLVAWRLEWFKRKRYARFPDASLAMNEKRRQLKAQGAKIIGTGDDGGGAFDGASEEFINGFEKSFRQFLSQLYERSQREKEQLLRESGMNGKEPVETRDLIATGEVARACFSSLLKMQSMHGGGRDTLFPMQRNKQQWLTELPALIQSTTQELREKTDQANRLGDDVSRQKEIIDRQARELGEAEKERMELIRSREELRKKLQEANQKGEDTQAVLDAVEKVSAVANNFQQGLRYYLDQKKDTGGTAVIMALINYSLSKLCQGYAEQQEVLVNAMLVNLYTISGQLKDVHGFKTTVQEMEKCYTGIGSLRQRLATTDSSHPDDKMFQVLLKHLREQEKIDLAPFYFAIDQEKKVHYAN